MIAGTMFNGPSPGPAEEPILQGLLDWCRVQPHCTSPRADTLFRCMNPQWIKRFTLRDTLLPWVLAQTGLATFYPDELDAASTPRSLARHLARRVDAGDDSPIRPPAIPFRTEKVKGNTAFVLNCPRSGSTLLRCMLMGHDALYAPSELHLVGFRSMRERERRFTESRQDWKTLGLAQTIAHLQGWNKWQAFHYVSHLTKRDVPVPDVYRLLHELCPKAILIDKSPSVTGHLQEIERTFENPRYLYLTRHPYPVIESMMRVRVDPPFPEHTFVQAERTWLEVNRDIVGFLEGIPADRWHRLSFEDLMSKTEETLRGVTHFFGLPYRATMADPYRGERLQEGIGCVNFRKRKNLETELGERWKCIRLPERLGKETGELALRLGYTLH